MKKLLIILAKRFPEGRLKNFARTTILKFRIAAPRELMVNPGDTVVQVGMWRERSAKRLANTVGAKGRILFVEVSESAIETLKNALADSPCQNIEFVNKGAWESKGELELMLEENSASTRLDTGMLHPGEGKAVKKIVQVDTIENICSQAGIENIDYIEITVNGAELAALKGMGNLIHKTKRLWVAGLTRDPESGKPLNGAIANYLKQLGLRTITSRSGRKFDSEWGRLDGHVYGWH